MREVSRLGRIGDQEISASKLRKCCSKYGLALDPEVTLLLRIAFENTRMYVTGMWKLEFASHVCDRFHDNSVE